MSQVDLARALDLDGNGAVSKIENARTALEPAQVDRLARVLGCSSEFLLSTPPAVLSTRPWLRAYADAPVRTVEAIMADNSLHSEVVDILGLRRIPDGIPLFDGDANDPEAIESFATEVRATINLDEESPVGNVVRAAENLGCVVLPLADEMGRHLGISQYINGTPYLRASRARANVPGDRQRFTVAHELGHLALHSGRRPPETAEEARLIENQAHRFAGAFLVPRRALLTDLGASSRITLTTLTKLKATWGVAIKMLVVRLRQLGVISETQSTSLYKQISKRGWNTGEPVAVDNEAAIWMEATLNRAFPGAVDFTRAAANATGLEPRYFESWMGWASPLSAGEPGQVLDLPKRPIARSGAEARSGGLAPVTALPHARSDLRGDRRG